MAIIIDNENNKILVDQFELALNYKTNQTPSGVGIEEGSLWYNPDNNQLKVYREVSLGTFEWVPIMIGDLSPDSDTIDAGAF